MRRAPIGMVGVSSIFMFRLRKRLHRQHRAQPAALRILETACGRSDVDSWNGVTALAGWDNNNVSIGYRDAGSGRVWFTEFDWQDSENYPFDYTKQLMSYMVINK